jgi:hypothetical protein
MEDSRENSLQKHLYYKIDAWQKELVSPFISPLPYIATAPAPSGGNQIHLPLIAISPNVEKDVQRAVQN